ncbi:MAG TPA: ABC transporter ATP-binding protein [Methanoregulaceae archaeon]|nr:ABC transporter ATP-binding protein [Methanoregulaceae archaeon]HQJ88834.1 ABC transporter ATP-binding protein [Methanoregulaceae archaeon]
MIRVEGLRKTYRMGNVEVRALDGVTLEVTRGEFVGITGPSGSGKSTLLQLVGLLDEPTAGSISIQGTDVLRLSDDERTLFRLNRIGYIFQDYALVPDLTALENVVLPTLARGATERDGTDRARELLRLVGLGERTDHLPAELSGGEQQRIAIARALVNEPALLLADEPCANLDTRASTRVLDLFASINRELGQTVLMVSHEESHRRYFGRIVRLQDGVIVDDTGTKPSPG